MVKTKTPALVMTGLTAGLSQLPGLEFRADRPYCGCRICGTLYQSDMDRAATSPVGLLIAQRLRGEWSVKHAKTHSALEHSRLAASGAWCTPEAAFVMAAFGVVPVTDMVLNDEIKLSLAESSAIPFNDVES